MVTENKLQAQVIQLQKTVIDVLQDVVQIGRGLTDADMEKIIAAQNTARDGALGALKGQYQRMIMDNEPGASKPREERPPPSRRASQASQKAIDPVYAPSRRASVVPQEYCSSRQSSIYQPVILAPLVREPSDQARSPAGPSRRDSVQSDPINPRVVEREAWPRKTGSDHARAREPDNTPRKAASDPLWQNGQQNVESKSRVDRPEAAIQSPEKIHKPSTETRSKAPAPQESKVVHPSSVSSPSPDSRTSDKAQPVEDLPPLGNHGAFCRYALDLQTNPLPLHHNFRSSGSQRCPACDIVIPVNNRDVWVFSMDNPTPGKPPRDYRMDARFVAKCHASNGNFACLLCEKYRTMDCHCRSLDALVKHLGSAHTAEEFERDGDLTRMKKGSSVNVNGREMVLT